MQAHATRLPCPVWVFYTLAKLQHSWLTLSVRLRTTSLAQAVRHTIMPFGRSLGFARTR